MHAFTHKHLGLASREGSTGNGPAKCHQQQGCQQHAVLHVACEQARLRQHIRLPPGAREHPVMDDLDERLHPLDAHRHHRGLQQRPAARGGRDEARRRKPRAVDNKEEPVDGQQRRTVDRQMLAIRIDHLDIQGDVDKAIVGG